MSRVQINRATLKKIMVKASQDATKRAGDVTARRVRSLITSRGRVRTGAWRRSIKVRRISPYRVEVYSDLPYSNFQEEGTRPHVIKPRRMGGVLVFEWPKAGGTVYLRRVNHPGFKGAHVFRDAAARLTLRDFLS